MKVISRTIILIALLTALAFCDPSISMSHQISSSSGSAIIQEAGFLDSTNTILAIGISILTILAAMGAAIKNLFSESEVEKRVSATESEIISLKSQIDRNHTEMKDLITMIRNELSTKSSCGSVDFLFNGHHDLEKTVNVGINKLNDTVSELAVVETKLNEIKNHFDENNTERKQEIKEINDTIKILRENIREDINDVKSVIMKMMMNLRSTSND